MLIEVECIMYHLKNIFMQIPNIFIFIYFISLLFRNLSSIYLKKNKSMIVRKFDQIDKKF